MKISTTYIPSIVLVEGAKYIVLKTVTLNTREFDRGALLRVSKIHKGRNRLTLEVLVSHNDTDRGTVSLRWEWFKVSFEDFENLLLGENASLLRVPQK